MCIIDSHIPYNTTLKLRQAKRVEVPVRSSKCQPSPEQTVSSTQPNSITAHNHNPDTRVHTIYSISQNSSQQNHYKHRRQRERKSRFPDFFFAIPLPALPKYRFGKSSHHSRVLDVLQTGVWTGLWDGCGSDVECGCQLSIDRVRSWKYLLYWISQSHLAIWAFCISMSVSSLSSWSVVGRKEEIARKKLRSAMWSYVLVIN
jgi:hypothetical protein